MIYKGIWKCPSCDTNVDGPKTICTSCGSARPANVKFQLPTNAPVVTDVGELRAAKAGPDWYCDHCSSANKAPTTACSQCGEPRTSIDTTHGVQRVRSPVVSQSRPRVQSLTSREYTPVAAPRSRRRLVIIVGSLITLLIAVVWYLLTPTGYAARVTGYSWHRSIHTEKYETVQEEAWDVPAGGRVVSRRRAFHHNDRVLSHHETKTRQVTERVQDGTKDVVVGKRDLGNGYFDDIVEEQPTYKDVTRTETYEEPVYIDVPVYRNKYTYDIDRWVPAEKLETSGSDQQPRWPQVLTSATLRETKRTEAYTVHFTLVDTDEEVLHKVADEAEWRDFDHNQFYRLHLDRLGFIHDIERIEAEAPQ